MNRFSRFAVFATALVVLEGSGLSARAGTNLTRGTIGIKGGNQANQANSTSQTSTAATNATSQAAQAAQLAARAQISMQRSVQALQIMQAQANAQSAARNLVFSGGNPMANAVRDGIALNGLMPSQTPTTTTTVNTVVNSNGTSSVTLAAGTAITLPPSATAGDQITVSGTGTVGTITVGNTITPLTGGTAVAVAPGATISLTNGGTIDFAAGSATVPSTFSTYAFGTAQVPSAVPTDWTGVSGITQTTYGSGASQDTAVTVTQDQQQALLNWQTFNIGTKTTLDFDQSAGGSSVANWIVFNKVAAGVAPSEIFGAIQAPGQVYVINQNGIIFGGSSQVNTGALVASSLPINDNLVQNGLLNNPDNQFLFSQLNIAAGTQTAAFTPAAAPTTGTIAQVSPDGTLTLVPAASRNGDVVVQPGAQLTSPTTPEHVGGKIALVGPNVNNGGTISSPDGQVILAAGLQVGFAASSDPTLRGLIATVGQVTDPGYAGGAAVSGTATNRGDIEAPRADTMITGENVNQSGVINSSTSVALNGRVDLLASYGAQEFVNSVNGFGGSTGLYSTETGAVTFGLNSLTQIQPELSDTETVVGTSLALNSVIQVEGLTIDLQANSLVSAPSAKVTLNAGTWQQDPSGYQFFNTAGQVYLDQGATIDVSGSENVAASVADDIIPVQLLGTELANSPLQQNGALRGQTVYIDIRQTGVYDGTAWIGTPIGDVSGYVNLIPHTVGQLTTAGGTVTINAGNSVVTQPTSTIDVSGGWINYQGAMVQTTKVVANGIIYDISEATPERVYSGIYQPFSTDFAKYGISQSYASLYNSPVYDPGYIQGGNGGSLSITAPSMALDGNLAGNTVSGSLQTTPISQLGTTYAGATFLPTTKEINGIPDSSSLSLTFQGDNGSDVADQFPACSPTPPNVVFQNGTPSQTPVGAFAADPSTGDPATLPTDRLATVALSSDLVNQDGFGSLSIVNKDGAISVPAGVSLNMPLGGSLSGSTQNEGGAVTFSAANINIDGTISAPGGNLSFSVFDFSPYTLGLLNTPPFDPTRGDFTLGSSAVLSAAGQVIDLGNSSPEGTPIVIGGGSVGIAGYNVDLASGSVINSSGGAVISVANKQTFGAGGSISISAGQDLNFSGLLGGKLVLDSTLEGYSGTSGGSLSIKAPLIQIGGSTLQNGDTVASGNTLWLDQAGTNGQPIGGDFFSQGGFAKFSLSGLGEPILDANGNAVLDSAGNPEFMPAVLIAANTVLTPVAANWEVVESGSETYLQAVTMPLASERTPISLSFGANGVTDSESTLLLDRGDFVMGAGASITTDPQTNSQNGVTIRAQTVAILGSILIPGGTISVIGGDNFANVGSQQLLEPTVDLGPQSLLSTKGVLELTQNSFGYASGSVLAGGNITVSGDIVAEAGAVLDVSGASGLLDVAPWQVGQTSLISSRQVPVEEDSNGGSITLSGSQELFTDATLLGAAGGSKAVGGSLTISSGIFLAPGDVQSPLRTTLLVTQGGPTIPVASYYPAGETAIGHPVVDANGSPLTGQGYFAVDGFDNPNSGFTSLTLAGTVQFQGPINLTAARSLVIGLNSLSSSGGIISADSTVNLTAAYVELGDAFLGPETAQQQATPIYLDSTGAVVNVSPLFGTGSLNVNASLIDVGNLSLQGIGQASLTAADGDVRGDGTLDIAGSLTITAGQVYPLTDTTFMLAAYDHGVVAGSITIEGSGSRALPLSAGGTLDLYASDITQDGTLRAPIGTINLGSGVTSASPIDPLSNQAVDSTQQLILGAGSDTSVSEIDPATGLALDIPYGVNINGVQWNDPAGNNITTAGNDPGAIPVKSVTVSATNVQDQAGSVIDISGGGDIYAYQFVSGTTGTVDVLNQANKTYAILPSSYSVTPQGAVYSPAYSADHYSTADSPVSVGQEIYLSGGSGLQAGYYTLLPAIYALQPGAYLVSASSATQFAGSAQTLPNGASVVAGYLVNGLNRPASQPLFSAFQVESPAFVSKLGEYDISSGSTFFSQNAATANQTAPRLPTDAGQLVLAAQTSLSLQGSVLAAVAAGGQGSLVDIASPSAILIAGSDADLSNVPIGTLVLDSASLTAFGADSFLIGGFRGDETGQGTPVTVTTGSLTVDNSGTGNALTGPDIILVSKDTLTLDAEAQVEQGSRTLAGSAPLLVLGTSSVAGSGDGALLRVTSDPGATISRQGINTSGAAQLSIGQGATVSGTNLILDSTNQSTLLSTSLSGSAISIDSGLISLVLGTGASTPSPSGLVLTDTTLGNLQASATALSLLSYSTIDIYGSGDIGAPADSTGKFPIASFAMHAAAIRGDGGNVAINAQTISIDNSAGATIQGPAPADTAGGSLALNGGSIQLAAAGQTAVNGFAISGYDDVVLNGSSGILLESAGSTTSSTGTVTRGQFNLSVTGSSAGSAVLNLETPLITGMMAANQTISVDGALAIEDSSSSSTGTISGGLGASLILTGDSITDDSAISLASGTIKMGATSGNLTIGSQSAARLDVGGITKQFNDLPEYTSGGQIILTADTGSVSLAGNSTLNLAAPAAGGNGGSLTVSAPRGTFGFAGSAIQGSGGVGGANGNFTLDVGTVGVSTILNGNDLTGLEQALNSAGLTNSQSIRVRGGTVNGVAYDDVYLTGATAADEVRAQTYQLSTDTGSIFVEGGIDASGATGGSITLSAAGSVVLTSSARLSATGQNFNDAGQGGAITLDAGLETNGVAPVSVQLRDSQTGEFAAGTVVVDIENGATLDLSVVSQAPAGGTTVNLTSSGSSYLNLPQAISFTLPGGTPGNDIIAFTSAGTVTSQGVTTSFTAGESLSNLPAGSTIQLSAPGTVLFAGGSTGGAIPVALASGSNYTLGQLGDATGVLHLRAPQLADGSDLQVDPLQGTIVNASSVVLEGYKVYTPAGGSIDSALETTVFNDATTFADNTNTILTDVLGAAPTAAQTAFYQVTPGVEIVNPTGDLTLTNTWDLSTFRFGPTVVSGVSGSGVAGDLTLRAAGNLVFGYHSNSSASLSDGFTGYNGSTSASLWNATIMSGQSWSYQLTSGADFSGAALTDVQPLNQLGTLGGSVELGLTAPALSSATGGSTNQIVSQYYQVIRTGTGNITISAGGNVELLDPLATIYTAGSAAAPLTNFAAPNLTYTNSRFGSNLSPAYQAAYSQSGGNVTISAGGDIEDLVNVSGQLIATSSKELPTDWLFRQGFVLNGHFASTHTGGPVEGTSWWVDFANFFEDVGALGGGNVTLVAGNDIDNVDASVPTNARMPGTSPSSSSLIELGGGDLLVEAGNDISGGVYYVERGDGTLVAGGSIHSNSTRATLTQLAQTQLGNQPADPTTWLPTTLFLGQGSFDLSAQDSVLFGPVANPFLLPQSIYNSFLNKTYFSTYAESDSVTASALTGTATLKDNIDEQNGAFTEQVGSLGSWYSNVALNSAGTFFSSEPWIGLDEVSNMPFDVAEILLPPTVNVTSFSGDIDLVGTIVLSPAPDGTLNLAAAGSVNGFQPVSVISPNLVASASNTISWGSATINLSDADPTSIPSPATPESFTAQASGVQNVTWAVTTPAEPIFTILNGLFDETGTTNGVLQAGEALHTPGLLHADDTNPLRIYAKGGDISGLTLYSGKLSDVIASEDITDVSFYIQNDGASDLSLVSAGRDLIAYDPNSALRVEAQGPGNNLLGSSVGQGIGSGVGMPTDGDLQINGPGTLEVLAGRNLDLGVSSIAANGVGVGISSVGNQRNPYLPFAGANIVSAAGLNGTPNYSGFIAQFLAPGSANAGTYLPDLGTLMNLSTTDDDQIWAAFNQLPASQRDLLAQQIFYLALRDSGRNHSAGTDDGYTLGRSAVAALFPGNAWQGDISLTSREIITENGGNISAFAPGGQLTVGFDLSGNQPLDQGILTEDGGNISIFTNNDVDVGTSRIFTLNGGNIIIWSTLGNIAAGASSKTVQSAPPTRVVVDPQSAAVKTDLSGLATGGGIGVLQTVEGAAASDVDLIAPSGFVDAGDAGIRASGNLNIAAVQVLNAGNIQVGGKSSGVPTASAPNIAGLASASSAVGAANNAAAEVGQNQRKDAGADDEVLPSIITVDVIGYGGA